MHLPPVLGTALQQVTGASYRQETLGRVPYQLYVNLHGNSKDCRRSQRGDNRIRTRNQVEWSSTNCCIWCPDLIKNKYNKQ